MSEDEKVSKLALAEGFVCKNVPWSYLGEDGVNEEWKLWDNGGNVLVNGRRDYYRSLNDIAIARRRLLTTEDLQEVFISTLGEFIVPKNKGFDECIYELLDADPGKQADALGLTLGLWTREML